MTAFIATVFCVLFIAIVFLGCSKIQRKSQVTFGPILLAVGLAMISQYLAGVTIGLLLRLVFDYSANTAEALEVALRFVFFGAFFRLILCDSGSPAGRWIKALVLAALATFLTWLFFTVLIWLVTSEWFCDFWLGVQKGYNAATRR